MNVMYLSTKLNAKVADKVLVSYPETTNFFHNQDKIIYTGNPVRSIFYKANGKSTNAFLGLTPKKPILLVLGGSLGASQINNLIYENTEELLKHFFIIHQTGDANIEKAKEVLSGLKENAEYYKPYPFINEQLPDLVYSSCIVVSRSGANTVWELATLGKPMVLIPLEQGSSRGDQLENARVFEKAKAAIVLQGDSVNKLSETLLDLLNDEILCQTLGKNAKEFSNENVVKHIVEIIEDVRKK